jgi:hypothetical protein
MRSGPLPGLQPLGAQRLGTLGAAMLASTPQSGRRQQGHHSKEEQ